MKRLTVCLSIGLSVCLTNWGLYAVFCLLVQFTTFNITYCIHNIRLVLLSVYPSDVCTYLYVLSSIRLHVCAFWSTLLGPSVYLSVSRFVCLYVLMHVCLYAWLTPPSPSLVSCILFPLPSCLSIPHITYWPVLNFCTDPSKLAFDPQIRQHKL